MTGAPVWVCNEQQRCWVFHAQQFPVCIKNGPPRKGHTGNMTQLWEALASTWASFPVKRFWHIVKSMPPYIEAVLRAKGMQLNIRKVVLLFWTLRVDMNPYILSDVTFISVLCNVLWPTYCTWLCVQVSLMLQTLSILWVYHQSHAPYLTPQSPGWLCSRCPWCALGWPPWPSGPRWGSYTGGSLGCSGTNSHCPGTQTDPPHYSQCSSEPPGQT